MLKYHSEYLEYSKVSKKNNRKAVATCPCGKEFHAYVSALKAGQKSCGCMKGNHTHGMKGTRFYRAWRNMKDRCSNENNTYYKDYGGRGISVCDKWIKFEGFMADMYGGYGDDLSIDRIDNEGNYKKENCRWATMLEQGANKRNSITYKGESARQAGIRINGNPSLIYQRLAVGMDKREAFTKPSKRQK